MSDTKEQARITQECAGGCGERLEYLVVFVGAQYAPELRVNSMIAVSYAGGHLCGSCAKVVHEALLANRDIKANNAITVEIDLRAKRADHVAMRPSCARPRRCAPKIWPSAACDCSSGLGLVVECDALDEPCKACEVRRSKGLEGQCPACASERARNEMATKEAP